MKSVLYKWTYTPARFCLLTGNISNRSGRFLVLFLFCCHLVFQRTEQQSDPSLHIKLVYNSLAAHAIIFKTSCSQMDLFVLPTSKLTPSSLPLSFTLKHLRLGLDIFSHSVWWCALLLPVSLGLSYANKDWCLSFTPDFVCVVGGWGGGAGQN